MVRKRKIIVYIATSADGFIARADGSVRLARPSKSEGQLRHGVPSISRSTRSCGAGRHAIWRSNFKRKAWPGRPSIQKLRTMSSHAVRLQSPAPAGVEFVNEPSKPSHASAEDQRERHLDDGWRGIIASFLDEGEIDEFMIHVIPTFIGEGIPLIAPGAAPCR